MHLLSAINLLFMPQCACAEGHIVIVLCVCLCTKLEVLKREQVWNFDCICMVTEHCMIKLHEYFCWAVFGGKNWKFNPAKLCVDKYKNHNYWQLNINCKFVKEDFILSYVFLLISKAPTALWLPLFRRVEYIFLCFLLQAIQCNYLILLSGLQNLNKIKSLLLDFFNKEIF